MKTLVCLMAICSVFIFFSGCNVNFEQFGEFTVKYKKNGCKEITDGIGRKLLLVPRGCKIQSTYKKSNIVHIPVKRVAVYSTYNAALIKALGHADSIVGVITKKDKWGIPEIKSGIEHGRIAYLGQYTSIDYEKLQALKPDVVFTWDGGITPRLSGLGIPSVVTTTRIAKDLDTHINFIRFLAAFYNEEKKAKAFAECQFERIKKISARIRQEKRLPKVVWGDIYARKVQVEPGNSWAAEIVQKAGCNYLFRDLEGASCMQITLEKFFLRTKEADIIITYRGPETGITSKEMLRKSSRLLQTVDIRPMNRGKIYFTGWKLYQTADTAGIIAELATIIHPELFPAKEKTEYFFELPDKQKTDQDRLP